MDLEFEGPCWNIVYWDTVSGMLLRCRGDRILYFCSVLRVCGYCLRFIVTEIKVTRVGCDISQWCVTYALTRRSNRRSKVTTTQNPSIRTSNPRFSISNSPNKISQMLTVSRLNSEIFPINTACAYISSPIAPTNEHETARRKSNEFIITVR